MDYEKKPGSLRRLIALIGAGYRIDENSSKEMGDTVWLEHLSPKRAKEKALLVYEDGLVAGNLRMLDDDQLLIRPNEEEKFQRFLATVPVPTWWDRNCAPFYIVGAWVFLGGVVLILSAVMDFAWGLIRGMFT